MNILTSSSITHSNCDCIREDGLHEDTAHVVHANLDVALVAPGRGPRVLDEEVFISILGSVADGEHTVVELGSASRGEDTGVVGLEGTLVGLDSDRDGLLVEGSLERLGGITTEEALSAVDLMVVSDFDWALFLGHVAFSLNTLAGGVRIVGLGVERVSLKPVEGSSHGASIAALAVLGNVALDELFLGEASERVAVDEVRAFDGAGGRECPA